VQEKTKNTKRADIERALGHEYHRHLGHMEDDGMTGFIVEAAVRTTQNTVHRELKRSGIGFRDMLCMDKDDFPGKKTEF
jgi:hypothetical protein